MSFIEKRSKDNKLIYKINTKKKSGEFFVSKESSQFKFCEKIILDGFDYMPVGFYVTNGMGITASGNFLLKEFYELFGEKFELVVNTKRNQISVKSSPPKVKIKHSDLLILNNSVKNIKSLRNEEVRSTVRQALAKLYSSKFQKYKKVKPEYVAGALNETLSKPNIYKKLNKADKDKLESFIPEYLSKIKVNLSSREKLKIIFESIDASKKVYFNKIVKEFEKKLKSKSQTESDWQKFLSEYILILRNTYGEVLEKQSVSLEGKFPDFMLIDPYSYLDVYEIKKPTTNLLKYDKSRNNYYWDPEITKAISQVENYLYQIQRNSDSLTNDIRKNKNIDINIVRPLGYIIAGERRQLKKQKMIDDFRILNEALKNIDIIFYDDLLENLQSFIKNIK